MKKRIFYSFNRKEKGSLVIDELSSMLVMAFIIAMLFMYIGYSKMVQMRLAVDNVAKEYLYQMEQEGYLSDDMMNYMKNDLIALGAEKNTINFTGTSHMEPNQAAYGDQVVLQCSVTFPNPLYALISAEEHSNGGEYNLNEDGTPTNPEGTMFTVAGLSPKITYKINMSATAKW